MLVRMGKHLIGLADGLLRRDYDISQLGQDQLFQSDSGFRNAVVAFPSPDRTGNG
jgi:hypothetical protein